MRSSKRTYGSKSKRLSDSFLTDISLSPEQQKVGVKNEIDPTPIRLDFGDITLKRPITPDTDPEDEIKSNRMSFPGVFKKLRKSTVGKSTEVSVVKSDAKSVEKPIESPEEPSSFGQVTQEKLGTLHQERQKELSEVPQKASGNTQESILKTSKSVRKNLHVSFAEDVVYNDKPLPEPDSFESIQQRLGAEADAWNLIGSLSENLLSNKLVMKVSSSLTSLDSLINELQNNDDNEDEDEENLSYMETDEDEDQDHGVMDLVSLAFANAKPSRNLKNKIAKAEKILSTTKSKRSDIGTNLLNTSGAGSSKFSENLSFLLSSLTAQNSIHIKRSSILELCEELLKENKERDTFVSYFRSVDLPIQLSEAMAANSSDPVFQFCFAIIYDEIFTGSNLCRASQLVVHDEERFSHFKDVLSKIIPEDTPFSKLIENAKPKLSRISKSTFSELFETTISRTFREKIPEDGFISPQAFAVNLLKKLNQLIAKIPNCRAKHINHDASLLKTICKVVHGFPSQLRALGINEVPSYETAKHLLILNQVQNLLSYQLNQPEKDGVPLFILENQDVIIEMLRSLTIIESFAFEILCDLSGTRDYSLNNELNDNRMLLLKCYMCSLQIRISLVTNCTKLKTVSHDLYHIVHNPDLVSSVVSSLAHVRRLKANPEILPISENLELFALGYMINVIEDSECLKTLCKELNLSALQSLLGTQMASSEFGTNIHVLGYYGLLIGSIKSSEPTKILQYFDSACCEHLRSGLESFMELIKAEESLGSIRKQISLVLECL